MGDIPETEITIRFVRKGRMPYESADETINVDEFLFHDLPIEKAFPLFWRIKHQIVKEIREAKLQDRTGAVETKMGGRLNANATVEQLNDFLRQIEEAFERRRVAGYVE
ncbi:MAG: hypothetical protein BV459_03915 [Thermoplasmata archaeon M11B2D]|nr:MAG: hypothetical protein BV459_03915 [Thermoplasmata archaeon M11B2D]